MTRVGVVGTGALGRHHVRILASLEQAELVGIHDVNHDVAEALAAEHGTTCQRNLSQLLDQVDAVVVAAPTIDHRTLGCEVLKRGLHLLVEKPVAASLEEADDMLAQAGHADLNKKQVFAVGHVEFYNPAVRAFLALGETPRFVVAERLSPFSPRSLDIDVLLDLMIHDLQVLHAMDPSPIHEIRATGVEVLSNRVDIANARIELESGLVASLTASRVSAEATRKLRIFGHHRYCSIDYREQEIKGVSLGKGHGSGSGKPEIVPLEVNVGRVEPLRAELEAFLAACRGEDVDYVDGHQGRRALETALRIGEAIDSAQTTGSSQTTG